jgi:4-amino-4-deoxy-L-arabinose transferase-like glycosyltransferase
MQELDLNYGIGSGESPQRQLLQVILLLVASSVVFFVGIGKLALTDPDEGRYALIGRNMVDRHDYMEPWLGNAYYAKKPPLYFWMTAASFKIFGLGNPQFSARVVPVLGAVLTILATYLVASTLFNHTLGLISAGCLLSTVMMVGVAKFVRMDIYMVAFLTLAFWAFLKGYKTRGASRWFLLVYPFLALVALVKSPFLLVIPFGIMFLFIVWQRLAGQGEWKVLGDMRLILGLAIIIAVAGPWFMYMVMQHSDYAYKFFVVENFDRVGGTEKSLGHRVTFLVYILTFLWGLLPWTPLAILGILRYSRSALSRGSSDWASRFLFLWFLVVLAVFSVSQTKLFHYVFPAFIPVSIFLGRLLYDYWHCDFPRRRRQLTFSWVYPMGLVVSSLVVGMYLLAVFGAGWFHYHERWIGLPDLYPGAWWGGWIVKLLYRLVLAVGLAKILWYLWRNWLLPQLVVTIAAAFLVLAVDLAYTDLPRLADLCSCRRLAPLIRANADPSTLILEGPVTHNERWSLPFYLGDSMPVQYIRNMADLSGYYANSRKMILLSRDTYACKQVRLILDKRVKVLTEYRDTMLLLIQPKESPLSETPAAELGKARVGVPKIP